MALNFPSNPVLDQIYVGPLGQKWKWNGDAWISFNEIATVPTASLSLGGSGSFSGSFSGSGADLRNIPSSAIVGLNLSQISSGSVSASMSQEGLLVNTRVVATSFTGSLFGTASYSLLNLQQVTDNGTTTTNNITVSNANASFNVENTTPEIFAGFEADNSEARINIGVASGNVLRLKGGLITGDRIINFPNKSGTLPLSVILENVEYTADDTGSIVLGAVKNAATASYILASGVAGLNLTQITTGSVSASVSVSTFSVTSGSVTEFVVTGTGVTIGNAATDRHTVTGSLNSPNITGSLFGTASWAVSASWAPGGGGGGVSSITIADEGTSQGTATFINFTGAGVTATVSSNTASINIPGGGSSASPTLNLFNYFNFF